MYKHGQNIQVPQMRGSVGLSGTTKENNFFSSLLHDLGSNNALKTVIQKKKNNF